MPPLDPLPSQQNPVHTLFFFVCVALRPDSRSRPPLAGLCNHTQAHDIRKDSSGQVTSPTQRSPPDNTQHSKETYIHASAGIQTRNPSKWAPADPSLRPGGHWDRGPHLQPLFFQASSVLHLPLFTTVDLFRRGSSTKFLRVFHNSYMFSPSQSSWFYGPSNILQKVKLWSFSWCSLLQLPINSSLILSNIRLPLPFSQTCSIMCFSP